MVEIRDAGEGDGVFLAAMLVEAAAWRPDSDKPLVGEVLASAAYGRYLEGWPRPEDGGVVAEDDSGPVGAAWYRLFDVADAGYGFVADDVPEVTIGVVERRRGDGIGRALIRALVAHARAHGHGALSLSVEPDNFARQLYESEGFQEVGRLGGALTMKLQLTPV